MGFFSWKTQDTDKSIANVYSDKKVFGVTMTDNKGNHWYESQYEGYGVFGGKDYYELLAEMNGKKNRNEGIDLAFDENKNQILYPNLSESKTWEWKPTMPKNCKYQGYFYP